MRFKEVAPAPIYVDSGDDIEYCIKACSDADILGVDTETLGLLKDPDLPYIDSKGKTQYNKHTNMTDQVVCMGLSPSERRRFFVPAKRLHHFNALLASDVTKALANPVFDAHRLANTCGATLGGPWLDTVHMDFLYDEDLRENKHGLKPCMKDYLGISGRDYKELFGTLDPREFEAGHEMWEKYLDYSTLDPWATRKVALILKEKLEKIIVDKSDGYTMMDLYWNSEEPQLKCLFDMERRGMHVDSGRLEEIRVSLDAEMAGLALEINKIVGRPINPNSTQQMGEYLFKEVGLAPLGYTEKTRAPQVDEAVYKFYGHGQAQNEVCKLAYQFKKASKLMGTYVTGTLKWVYKDGRVHTTYSAHKTTGRLGSAQPNLQNVPRASSDPHRIRAAYAPEPGNKFIVADYAQLEMRVMAEMSQDAGFIAAISSGKDLHAYTGSKMAGKDYEAFYQAAKVDEDPEAVEMRQAAKSVGFGILYCQGKKRLAEGLSETLGRFVTESEAQGYIDMFLTEFRGIKIFMDSMQALAKEQGFVQTMSGRMRRLSKIKSRSYGERGHAERQAVNTPIQGSAADIVKKVMINLNKNERLKELGWYLLHQVHDELIFEGPEEHAEEALTIIQYEMEHPYSEPLSVPLIAEPKIVDNWADAK